MSIALPSIWIAPSRICWHDSGGVAGARAALLLALLALSGLAWPAGATAPLVPALVQPLDGSAGVPNAPELRVLADDPDGDSLSVVFEGRRAWVPGPDFTLALLPDTQYYTAEVNGGDNRFFFAQAEWIMAHHEEWNIPFTIHVGDIIENGDAPYAWREWLNADSVITVLEQTLGGALPEGMPYHIACGNHEQWPRGDPDGTTIQYNYFFGSSRFAGRSYYGGHYGANNDNHWARFRASGLDFIIVSLEFDQNGKPEVIAWADSLLSAHEDALAILSCHYLIHTGNPARFGPQGQYLWDALKSHPNLVLMLCGHVAGEGRRSDTWEGRVVHSVLANYQNRENGGNGWMRLMRFQPAQARVQVRTYSPVLDAWEEDADSSSCFTLPLPALVREEPWVPLGMARVAAGEVAGCAWPGREGLTLYEWRARAEDGSESAVSQAWRFTTGPRHPLVIHLQGGGEVTRQPDEPGYDPGTCVTLTALPGEGWGFQEWSGDVAGSLNPVQVVIEGPTEVTAIFRDEAPPAVTVLWPDGGDTLAVGEVVDLRWAASDNQAVESIDLLLSRTGLEGPFARLAGWIENSGAWAWKVTGPPSSKTYLRVIARDAAGHAAFDTGPQPSYILVLPSDAGPADEAGSPLLTAPNPVRPGGTIRFRLPADGPARLRLFDVAGRELACHETGPLARGAYQVGWTALAPRPLASGVYCLTLDTPAGRASLRLVALP